MTQPDVRLAHVRSAYGVRYCGSRHPVIKSLQANTPPTFFGSRLWRSSFMLMEYLTEHPLEQSTQIMEVGCGWGLLGIFCAKSFNCSILLTDQDDRVFPYTEAHLVLNNVHAETAVLGFQDMKQQHFIGKDVVIGSDICFWPELVGSLKKLIGNALAAGVQTVIIADPGRYTFLQVAKHCEEHYHTQLLRRHLSDQKGDGYLLIVRNPVKKAAAA